MYQGAKCCFAGCPRNLYIWIKNNMFPILKSLNPNIRMSPNVQDGIHELETLFQSFFDTFNRNTHIQGDAVPDSLTCALGLSFDSCQRFWKPRTLKQNAFHDVITIFDDEDFSQPPPEKGCLNIYDAYTGSQRTLAAVSQGVFEGMFYSDDFFDSVTGTSAFVELE